MPPSSWTIAAGTESAPRLHPALGWDENQVVSEEALPGLFLRPTTGQAVCLLQDEPEAQAEAGLMGWSPVEIDSVIVDIYYNCVK